MASAQGGVRGFLLVAVSVVVAASAAAASAPQPAMQSDPPEVGTLAPGFSLQSIDGEDHALQELRGEAPLLLVFFRGVW